MEDPVVGIHGRAACPERRRPQRACRQQRLEDGVVQHEEITACEVRHGVDVGCRIEPRVEVEPVVPRPSGQLVRSRAAEEAIGSPVAGEPVVAVPAEQHVATRVALQEVRSRVAAQTIGVAGSDQVLDREEGVPGRLSRVRCRRREVHDDSRACRRIAGRVRPGAAVVQIRAGPAGQPIRAIAAVEPIVSGKSDEDVPAISAGERVAGPVAHENIVVRGSGQALDLVVGISLRISDIRVRAVEPCDNAGQCARVARIVDARTAEQTITAGPSRQTVIPGPAVDRIVAGVPEKRVVPREAVDDVRGRAPAHDVGAGCAADIPDDAVPPVELDDLEPDDCVAAQIENPRPRVRLGKVCREEQPVLSRTVASDERVARYRERMECAGRISAERDV